MKKRRKSDCGMAETDEIEEIARVIALVFKTYFESIHRSVLLFQEATLRLTMEETQLCVKVGEMLWKELGERAPNPLHASVYTFCALQSLQTIHRERLIKIIRSSHPMSSLRLWLLIKKALIEKKQTSTLALLHH